MTWKCVPVLIALSAAGAGCSCYTGGVTGGWDLFTNAFRNLGEEPVRYVDDVCFTMQLKRLANEAWRNVVRASPDQHFSPCYAEGFKAGFTDYLESGGCAQPPATPPFCFQLSCYRSAEGNNSTQDWYAGFRHGATAAQESGLRDEILVPLSALPIRPPGPTFADIPPSSDESHPATDPPSKRLPAPVVRDELPPPKELDPPPDEAPRKPAGPKGEVAP